MQTTTKAAFFLTALVWLGLSRDSGVMAQTKQDHVHHMGHTVMPFALDKTTHLFRMTVSGGVQSVVVKNPNDTKNIAAIRQHLKYESEAFGKGNYADPKSLHGASMPGVSSLVARYKEVSISYADLPLGASLTFSTSDQSLVTEIHRWFGAQLSEHGADAKAE